MTRARIALTVAAALTLANGLAPAAEARGFGFRFGFGLGSRIACRSARLPSMCRRRRSARWSRGTSHGATASEVVEKPAKVVKKARVAEPPPEPSSPKPAKVARKTSPSPVKPAPVIAKSNAGKVGADDCGSRRRSARHPGRRRSRAVGAEHGDVAGCTGSDRTAGGGKPAGPGRAARRRRLLPPSPKSSRSTSQACCRCWCCRMRHPISRLRRPQPKRWRSRQSLPRPAMGCCACSGSQPARAPPKRARQAHRAGAQTVDLRPRAGIAATAVQGAAEVGARQAI